MHAAYPGILRDPNQPNDLGRLEVSGVRISSSRFAALRKLRPHEHEFACLTVALRGSVEKSFATSTVEVCSPGAIAMPPQEPHRARFGRDDTEVLMIEPMGDHAAMLGTSTRLFGEIQPIQDPVVSSLAWRLRREFAQPDSVTPMAVAGLVLEMLAIAARRTASTGARPTWIGRAVDYLHAHFMAPVELTDLARAVSQPPGQVMRQFRSHLGLTPHAYVRQLRIDWAVRELVAADRSLSDIALAAGFADQSHFTRVFKRLMGVSPGRFRRLARA